MRYVSIGKFVRQHDPDFIDGNTISVFDNNHRFPSTPDLQSRILVINASKNIEKTYYEGSVESPFFTDIRGKHQWLPNGNLLITESSKGRAFEIDQEKNIVWEYVNIVDERTVGIVTEVQRLPLGYAGFK